MELNRTPLYQQHLQLGARMAPFAGYEMPISYDERTGGSLKEHLAVRQHMGIFDVSHMGEFWVRGAEATEFLSFVCTRSFTKLADGKAQYCLLLNEKGTILDDIIVYRFDAKTYWVVVNASNITKDFAHLKAQSSRFSVELEDVSDRTSLLAIQGPKAVEAVNTLIPGISSLKYYHFAQFGPYLVARTGYTGEDGVEIFTGAPEAVDLWTKLLKLDAVPIGLGARDTLRLEVGFPLYGHELSEDLYPRETFSAFATDLKHNFLGAEQARQAPRYLPIALTSATPKPFRQGERLLLAGEPVGVITSGSISPARRIGIALALVELSKIPMPLQQNAVFLLESAGKQREAVRTNTPFVNTARVKGEVKSFNK